MVGVELRKTPLQMIREVLFQGRFGTLMVALVLLVLVIPLLEASGPWVQTFFFVFMLCIILASVRAVCRRRGSLLFFTVFGVVAFGFTWFSVESGSTSMEVVDHVLQLAFFTMVAVGIIFHVIEDKDVTMDKIFGALSAYLMLGMIWAILYSLLEVLDPGSLSIGNGGAATTPGFSPYLYFSFVTLATLGYGDVVPGNGAVGAFAAMEAVIGQIYLVVLVARLVALHIQREETAKK